MTVSDSLLSTVLTRRKMLGALAAALCNASCTRIPSRSNILMDCFFLSVGYGDAILLQKNNSQILVDGGYPVFTSAVLSLLKQRNIHRLDAVILTHPHPDHIGGVFGVLDSGFSVGCVYGIYPLAHPDNPIGFQEIIHRRHIEYRVVAKGDIISAGNDLHMEVLHPDLLGTDMNENSMVLKCLEPKDFLLLTADIGLYTQKHLLSGNVQILRSRILKAPHHGGELFDPFLQAVNPEAVIISTGINPYGNPAESTVSLLEKLELQVYRTDRSGSIHVRLYENGELGITTSKVPRGTLFRY
ncbi:MBL fold metallo-hydrolase [bacterium]|nr:MBL fold metallo-hydrolase [candidate division CSSED10-310 bacterium]